MDPLSIAASVVGVATVGIQISVKTVTLAGQVATASDRVSDIGNDISLTSGILHQLGDLINEKTASGTISILSKGGLATTKSSAEACRKIFLELKGEITKATELLRGRKHKVGEKVKLSIIEKAKWPFLQPGLEVLRTNLREAKGTLMLMLQLATLGLSKKMAELNSSTSTNVIEQKDIIRSILILQQQQQQQHQLHAQQAMTDLPGLGSANIAQSDIINRTLKDNFDNSKTNSAANPVHNQLGQKNPGSARRNPGTHNTSNTSDGEPAPTASTIFSASTAMPNTDKPRVSWVEQRDHQNTKHPFGDEPIFGRKEPDVQMCFIDPKIIAFDNTIEISWTWQSVASSTDEVRERLAWNRAHDPTPILEKLEDMDEFERGLVTQGMDNIGPSIDAKLLSLKRVKKDLQQGCFIVRAVPSFRLIIELKARLQDSLFGPNHAQPKNRRHRIGKDLARPTYVKVHKRYLLPETLDAYNLPWQWDDHDSSYLLIKRWIPEADQEILFDHTRQLKEDRKHRRSRFLSNCIAESDSSNYSDNSWDGPRFGSNRRLGESSPRSSEKPLDVFGTVKKERILGDDPSRKMSEEETNIKERAKKDLEKAGFDEEGVRKILEGKMNRSNTEHDAEPTGGYDTLESESESGLPRAPKELEKANHQLCLIEKRHREINAITEGEDEEEETGEAEETEEAEAEDDYEVEEMATIDKLLKKYTTALE